ncbi:MAG: GNAT family N-acetyltransferase [Ktedonobacteraceae bacterium]|nr:GNAT family N-acetyltransferase [Ktedonobacteraceae bacterium]
MSIETAFTYFPSLSTNRLHLRQIKPTDAEALFAIRSDREVMDFYGEEPHQSLEDTHALIQQLQDSYNRREAILWGITLKGEDIIIGSGTLFSFGPGSHYAETGYELHRAYWRQGIMAEAMPAILTYGFTELGLHRIEAAVDPRNTRSKGLLLRLGFTYEGNLRQRFFFRDQFLDAHYFGLLKDEWLKAAILLT